MYPYVLPGMATEVEEERKLMVTGMHARTSNAQPALTCHLKPPQREAEGLREMNPSDVRVKSTGGGGGGRREARRQLS